MINETKDLHSSCYINSSLQREIENIELEMQRFAFSVNKDSYGWIDGWVGGEQIGQQVEVWTVGCLG